MEDYDGNVTVLDGYLNGLTYVDGSIQSLQGTSKGAFIPSDDGDGHFDGRYIVASPETNRSINLTGNLLSFYGGDDTELKDPQHSFALKRGKLNQSSEHALGLFANNVFLNSTHQETDIYAVILAGLSSSDPESGFGSNPSKLNLGPLRNFNLYGGLVTSFSLPWNVDGSGYIGNLIYDQAVADGLPRFPQTNRVITLRYADQFMDKSLD